MIDPKATLDHLDVFRRVCGPARLWLQSLGEDADEDAQWASCPDGSWLLWRLEVDPKIDQADSDTLALIVWILQHCAFAAIENAGGPTKAAQTAVAQQLGAILHEQDVPAAAQALRKQLVKISVPLRSDAEAVQHLLTFAIGVVHDAVSGNARTAVRGARNALTYGSAIAKPELLQQFADIVRAHIPKITAFKYVTLASAVQHKEIVDHGQ